MPVETTEDFLAHYGVKGMKWGVKRTDAQLERAAEKRSGSSSATEGDSKTGMSRKKKAAIAGGVLVGGAALLTVAAVVKSQQYERGQNAAKQQIRDFGSKSMWELAATLPSQPKTSAPKKSTPLPTKGGKAKNKAAAKAAIQNVGKKSMWDLAVSLPETQKAPSKQSSKTKYSNRAVKKDTQMYGTKGANRIRKRLDRGESLSSARQKEALRKHGMTAARVALNIGTAKAQENMQQRMRR